MNAHFRPSSPVATSKQTSSIYAAFETGRESASPTRTHSFRVILHTNPDAPSLRARRTSSSKVIFAARTPECSSRRRRDTIGHSLFLSCKPLHRGDRAPLATSAPLTRPRTHGRSTRLPVMQSGGRSRPGRSGPRRARERFVHYNTSLGDAPAMEKTFTTSMWTSALPRSLSQKLGARRRRSRRADGSRASARRGSFLPRGGGVAPTVSGCLCPALVRNAHGLVVSLSARIEV